MNRTYQFETLDVFTTQRFRGNPLAVVKNAEGLSTDEMQTIAREFNLAETTFIFQPDDDANDANVRIFTPTSELPFAGHPTIGTAISIATSIHNDDVFDATLTFEEKAGLVPVVLEKREGSPARAQFIAPHPAKLVSGPLEIAKLGAACSLTPDVCGLEGHNAHTASSGTPFTFLPVRDMQALAAAVPNSAEWDAAAMGGGRGIFLYTKAEEGDDAHWRARMFAPKLGITEDPATGAANAAFPAQLLAAEELGDGTHSWRVKQGYEMGRPSQIDLSADVLDGAINEVRVGGAAVFVSRGEIEI